MKQLVSIFSLIFCILLCSCEGDKLDLVIPYPNAITFSDLKITERFSHVIPENGFSTNGITFNTMKSSDGQLSGGFCYSNRSYRQFANTSSVEAIDSMKYSIWTTMPNTTGTYLVCNTSDDKAFFTLETPTTIEYILVGNTTWDYLSMAYGNQYGTEEEPVVNLNQPSSSISSKKIYGVWYTNVPGGVKKFTEGDYFTLTAVGYLNDKVVGELSIDLACKEGHNEEHPTWDYIASDWRRFDLGSIGAVDKILFKLDSSDKDINGKMKTPPFFCIDGIKLNK